METVLHDGAKYIRAVDLARAAKVTSTAVYRAIRAGRLPSVMRLGARLVPLAAARAYARKVRKP